MLGVFGVVLFFDLLLINDKEDCTVWNQWFLPSRSKIITVMWSRTGPGRAFPSWIHLKGLYNIGNHVTALSPTHLTLLTLALHTYLANSTKYSMHGWYCLHAQFTDDLLDDCLDEQVSVWCSAHFGLIYECKQGPFDRRISKHLGSGKELPIDLRNPDIPWHGLQFQVHLWSQTNSNNFLTLGDRKSRFWRSPLSILLMALCQSPYDMLSLLAVFKWHVLSCDW